MVRDAGDPRTWSSSVSDVPPAGRPRSVVAAPVLIVSGGGYVFGHGDADRAHIIWDWNGTLFHDNDAIIGATNAAFAELGLASITLEQYRALYCVRCRSSTSG